MDFSLPPRIADLLPEIEAFVEAELYPREHLLVSEGFYAAEPTLDALRAEVKARGWWAPHMPKDVGGLGLSLLELGLVGEVLGRTPIGHYTFGCQAPDAGNLEILHLHGTPQQQERWLAPLLAGEIRSCFAMTEPDTAGSNPTLLECSARAHGDDYVINGRKWFTTAADGAAFTICMAVTNPDAPRHMRATQIIVPTDTPGFERVRNISIMGHAGEGWASHAEVRFDNCRVPQSNRLGVEGSGFAIAQERLGPGRIHHCMRWLGICERAFRLMCDRAAAREIAPERPLSSRQIVQAWIAESRAAIDAARLAVLETAWRIDKDGFKSVRDRISLIKFHVAGVMQQVVDRAVQVHGGLGVTDDTPLAFFYGHERAARIYDGPDEVHKISAAKRIIRARTEQRAAAPAEAAPPSEAAPAAKASPVAPASAISGTSTGTGTGRSKVAGKDLGDGTRAVREGEELDVGKLLPYLRGVAGLDLPDGELEVEQFPSGHSNLTYLLRIGERELVLRRPPFGSKVKTAHDMGREFTVLSGLSGVYGKVPRVLHHDDSGSVLGAPFYLMERVRGVILRKKNSETITIAPDDARRLSDSFVDTLVELHAVDPAAAGLGDFGRPEGYIRRQVEGWTKRYGGSKTDEIPTIDRLAAWLAERIPDITRASVIHNDYKFDNMVLAADDIADVRYLLDWEMSTVGDPLMDLGTALCYWVEAGDDDALQHFRFGPTHLPGMATRAQLAERYLARSGRGPLPDEELLFYYCFGLFKTAVVVQQIYYRYKKGLTKDPRFAAFILGVQVLAEQAERAIGAGKL